MLPIPIIAALGKAGLGLLAKAGAKKGAEYLKDKTGIDLGGIDLVNGEIPDDVAANLKALEMEHEETLQQIALETLKVKANVITATSGHAVQAHQADMKSDSWMSKNIRPLCLAVVLVTVISGLFIDVPEGKYAEIVGLCKRAFEFYFGGRSIEKISGGAVQRGAKTLYNKIRGK